MYIYIYMLFMFTHVYPITSPLSHWGTIFVGEIFQFLLGNTCSFWAPKTEGTNPSEPSVLKARSGVPLKPPKQRIAEISWELRISWSPAMSDQKTRFMRTTTTNNNDNNNNRFFTCTKPSPDTQNISTRTCEAQKGTLMMSGFQQPDHKHVCFTLMDLDGLSQES